MNDYSYVETSVKRKETIKTNAIRILMILGLIFAFFLSLTSIPGFVIGLVGIFAIVYFLPLIKVEHEYVYVDGQLDFDKIMGDNKRKRKLRIELEQVEIIAPLGSQALDQYKQQGFKTKDFSSKDPEVNPYVIIYRKGDEAYRILFEPNDKMKEAIKAKAYRKIIDE